MGQRARNRNPRLHFPPVRVAAHGKHAGQTQKPVLTLRNSFFFSSIVLLQVSWHPVLCISIIRVVEERTVSTLQKCLLKATHSGLVRGYDGLRSASRVSGE
ncbi:hypothetical protein TNCV_3270881 [Trichonephila clavipes]|nr:hypothetical protein TNCV_3270881 [Trichonephila clavipes]